ncbi:MAG: tetratricopeptide repeat protein [bacterium]
MDWPIMVDSLNLLGVSAVPITLLIDECGVIRGIRPNEEEFNQFLSQEFSSKLLETSERFLIDEALLLSELEGIAGSGGNFDELMAYADALFLWGGSDGSSRAVGVYRRALDLDSGSGNCHFRLGVALRKRYESEFSQKGDFLQAVNHWERALDIDPNQYIWRRRIQQYGPRLDKPYSFYDWVLTARTEITARGEKAVDLMVEPGGAEFALPATEFKSSEAAEKEPDPKARIRRDIEGMVEVETILVPHTSAGESSFRAHLVFSPASVKEAHWNNEADDMEIWISPPQGWTVDRQHLWVRVPEDAVSEEVRRVEFELNGPRGFSGKEVVPAYALYYVCEDIDGTCLYRRQDILIEVKGK